ncbi:MAG: hypothetical protein RLW62_20015 [Gammaproteobacteria bacterium]
MESLTSVRAARLYAPLPGARALALLALVALAPTLQAASLSAETRFCFGFTGAVDNPRLNCGSGGPQGTGSGVIIGGSGVGSGINVPFRATGGNELSASAAALQDYGVFRGYASYHVVEQGPDVFGGVYAANGWGTFTDTWTIHGGAGFGRLQLTFTVDGGTTASAFVLDGNGSESAASALEISARVDSIFGGGLSLDSAGTYTLVPNGPDAMRFVFGVPFELSVLHGIYAGGGYDRLDPPSFFQLDASATFQHTSRLTGVAVTDLFGNPIAAFTLTTQSGTQYPLAVPSAVPLPAGLWLLAGGLPVVLAGRSRRARSLRPR